MQIWLDNIRNELLDDGAAQEIVDAALTLIESLGDVLYPYAAILKHAWFVVECWDNQLSLIVQFIGPPERLSLRVSRDGQTVDAPFLPGEPTILAADAPAFLQNWINERKDQNETAPM